MKPQQITRRRWSVVVAATISLIVTGFPVMNHAEAATTKKASVPATGIWNYQTPQGGVFGPRSVWKADVRKAPKARNSQAMVADLTRQVTQHWGGVAAFNAYRYNTSFYTVRKSQRLVTVKFDDCQGKRYVPSGLYGAGGQFVDVPIPDGARPAAGTDGSLTIHQPSTDRMWDFWKAQKLRDGWHACWGGRMDKVSTSPGYFANGFGTTATGLSSVGGTIGIREAESGRIDHAMALQLIAPAVWHRLSYPAQRSDGWSTLENAIPEGTRLRLDPRVDVGRLGLHPVAAAIARAAQRYGFIVTDKSGAVSVVAESGIGTQTATGRDPWATLLRGTPDYAVMRNFPWSSLQALPQNWGKPTS
jgi:hypothetical protein